MLIVEEGYEYEYLESANDAFESFLHALALRAVSAAEDSGDAEEYAGEEDEEGNSPAESLCEVYWDEDYADRAENFFRMIIDELQPDSPLRTWDEIRSDGYDEIFLPIFVENFPDYL